MSGRKSDTWVCIPFLFLTLAPVCLVACAFWTFGQAVMGKDKNGGKTRMETATIRRLTTLTELLGRNRGGWLLTVVWTNF